MPRYEQNRRLFWTYILFILLPITLDSQTLNLDDLRVELAEMDMNALDSAYTQIQIAYYYIYHDLDSSTYYIDQVLDRVATREVILPDTFYKHMLIKAWTYQGRQEYNDAKVYLGKAMDIAKDNKNRDTRLELLMNLGSLLVQTRDSSTLDWVDKELVFVDTSRSKADYVMYTLLHQYQSQAYAQNEEYEQAIKSLLAIGGSRFLKKIPNYRYGIRSKMSQYLAFMDDTETATKQLEAALRDTLHKHQRKQVMYDLCALKIAEDSIASAKQYLENFTKIKPHTKPDLLSQQYLAAKLSKIEKDYHKALFHIDSAEVFLADIEDPQIQLDVICFKTGLAEFLPKEINIENRVQSLDSIMLAHSYLSTSRNRASCARAKLLNKFLNPDQDLMSDFEAYEQAQAQVVKKKIDPRLVAAVLDFDNDEQRLQIEALQKGNAEQELSLQNQSSQLIYSWWAVGFLGIISFILIGVNMKRKNKAELLRLEKIETERLAKFENQRLEEKTLTERKQLEQKQEALRKKAESLRIEKAELEKRALIEKQRLAAQAAAERKRLQEKQEELKNRVADIEQSNQVLEHKLYSSQKQSQQEYIVINTKTKVHKIKINQLKYVIAENDGTRFHLKKSSFWVIMPLKEVLALLPSEHFVRIFRSTVVNATFIMAVNSTYVVLENGEELMMSRTYRERVRERVG